MAHRDVIAIHRAGVPVPGLARRKMRDEGPLSWPPLPALIPID